jgi:hypothetical protein
MRKFAAILAICLSVGCGTIPFTPVPLTLLDDFSAEEVRTKAAAALPEQFTVLNSIVFKTRWHSMSALGYTSVDMQADTFAVQALNPMGIKLFEFSEKGGEVEEHYVMDHLPEKAQLSGAVAKDIRRIYFNRVPSRDAEVTRDKLTITFTEKIGNDTVRHVFGGVNTVLTEKQYYKGRRKAWTASYYEYQLHEGRLYPGGVVLKNHEHNYRLTVSLKEIS